jgi:hypothetical protein
MTSIPQTGNLLVSGVTAAREALLADPTAWPDPDGIDAAGVQLIVAAMKAGIVPPPAIREAPAIRAFWVALGCDDAADARLSLYEGRIAPGAEGAR